MRRRRLALRRRSPAVGGDSERAAAGTHEGKHSRSGEPSPAAALADLGGVGQDRCGQPRSQARDGTDRALSGTRRCVTGRCIADTRFTRSWRLAARWRVGRDRSDATGCSWSDVGADHAHRRVAPRDRCRVVRQNRRLAPNGFSLSGAIERRLCRHGWERLRRDRYRLRRHRWPSAVTARSAEG